MTTTDKEKRGNDEFRRQLLSKQHGFLPNFKRFQVPPRSPLITVALTCRDHQHVAVLGARVADAANGDVGRLARLNARRRMGNSVISQCIGFITVYHLSLTMLVITSLSLGQEEA